MILANLIGIDGGVYGGFDGCESTEFGCTNETNPLGLLLGFLVLCILYVVFTSINDSLNEKSIKRNIRKREQKKFAMDEWDRKRMENYNAERKKQELLTNEEFQSIVGKNKTDNKKSNRKRNVRKKAPKKSVVNKKLAKKKTAKKKTAKRK